MTSSLFLHHLDRPRAIELLCRLQRVTRRLLLVHDLRRTPMGLAVAWLVPRLITRSPVVHVDGPRSVRAAFTIPEVAQLAADAGLRRARVERCWPWRYLLQWRPA